MLQRCLPCALILAIACGEERAPAADNEGVAVLDEAPVCAFEGIPETTASVEHDAALQPDYQMAVAANGWPQRQIVLRLSGSVTANSTYDLSQQSADACDICGTGQIGSAADAAYTPVAGSITVEQLGTATGEEVRLRAEGLVLATAAGERWCVGDQTWSAAIEPWACTEATRLKGQVHTYRNHETVCFGDDVFLCQKVSDFEERSRAELSYIRNCELGCVEAIPGRAECNL